MHYLRLGAAYLCSGVRGVVLVFAGMLTVVSDCLAEARDRVRPD